MSDISNQRPRKYTSLPFVSVVMPAHNEEQYIAESLQSLRQQDYPADKFEIIVVDNNSTDRTAEIARSFGANVLFKEKGPVGAVRNYGAIHANGDILAFIDSDCLAPTNWLSEAVKLVRRSPNTAFGGDYRLRKAPHWLEKYWLLEGSSPRKPPAELIGGTIFIESHVFKSIGMFDETITSGEDSKLSISLRAKGFRVSFSDSLYVVHLGNPTDNISFFKRQIWHSENYLKDIKTSIKDKTFILIVAFYFFGLCSLISVSFGDYSKFAYFLLIFLIIPGIFSAKRILAVRYKPDHIYSLAYIYYLDFIYLIARSVGLTKSLINLLSNFLRYRAKWRH